MQNWPSLEAPAHSARADYPVKPDRLFDPFERRRSAIFDHEQARNQPMRRVSNGYGARFRCRLDSRGDIYVGEVARTALRNAPEVSALLKDRNSAKENHR